MPVQTYTVKGGDNLFSIAGSVYGNQRMFAEIMRLNGLTSGVIRPGMVLKLPQPKPDYAINVSGGLMNAVKAENDFVQQNKRMPTQQELQDFQAQQQQQSPFFGGTLSFQKPDYSKPPYPTSGTVESLMTYKSPAATPTAPTTTQYPSPYTSEYQPGYNVAQRGRGYTPVTRQEFAKGVGGYQRTFGVTGTPQTPEFLSGISKAMEGPRFLGGIGGTLLGTVAGIPGAITGNVIGQGLGSLAGAAGYTYQQTIEPYLNQQVDPTTGRVIYTQPLPKPPQAQTVAVYGPPKQAQPTQPTQPTQIQQQAQQKLYSVTFDTQTPNIPKSTMQEQQLPDPDTVATMTPQQLTGIGMTPEYAKYYSNFWSKEQFTPAEANQYRYVFNIQPGSDMDQAITLSTIGVTATATNDETMGSIWQELQNLGQYGTMPTEWIIAGPRQGGGGGGGGGGGSQGGGGQNYSSGGSMTWGGF